MPTLSKTNLKQRTEEYWEKHKGDYDCYIEELLGRELTYAQSHPLTDGTVRLHRLNEDVHTLALTVGESFEPLLQVTCVLKPKRVLLILNSFYGDTPGGDHGGTLKRLMKKLSQVADLPDGMQPSLGDGDFDLVTLDADTPTQVFQALRDALQKAKPPAGYLNAVDITGAKKSMVVGAFLYAAHSGLPITYVDFDSNAYNSHWGKPYGYCCRIGKIADPYEAFGLRDWEQVRQQYSSYNFRSARALLDKPKNEGIPDVGIMQMMSTTLDEGKKGRSLYEQTDINKVARLAKVMEMYEAWENGDYAFAQTLIKQFNPSLPQDVVPWGITELGDIWPSAAGIADAGIAADHLLSAHLDLKQGKSQSTDSIFGQPVRLLAYTRDEVAKIDRLVTRNEDYRSAFLRSAGLEDFLLKARLCLCWLAGVLDVGVGNNPLVAVNTLITTDQTRGFIAMSGHSSADAMRNTLRRKQSLSFDRKVGMQVQLSANAPTLDEYWKGKSLDFDAFSSSWGNPGFTRLRGEAIHTHLYIPKHVAEAALELVRAAVHEFETKWLEHFHPGTLNLAENKLVEVPPWHRLCEACGLEFLPPRLRE